MLDHLIGQTYNERGSVEIYEKRIKLSKKRIELLENKVKKEKEDLKGAKAAYDKNKNNKVDLRYFKKAEFDFLNAEYCLACEKQSLHEWEEGYELFKVKEKFYKKKIKGKK